MTVPIAWTVSLKMDLSNFHIITTLSNPIQYKSRYLNYQNFASNIKSKGAKLWTIEMQTGARPHQVTASNDPYHIQIWQSALPSEVWHKEQLINLAIARVIHLAPNCRYIAWVDADLKFEPGFIEKTVNQLQHYDIVQMYSHIVNLTPTTSSDSVNVGKSFMFCYWNNIKPAPGCTYQHLGSPGGAWAARREVLNKMGCAISGPILDFAILGSGDKHMACALIGRIQDSLDNKYTKNYIKWMHQYQTVVDRVVKRNVGYVDGLVRHLWHGRFSLRGYETRPQILIDDQFDPETDLTKDASGLWRLVVENPRQIKLRDDCRRYFRMRNEDSIDLTGENYV